MTPDQLIAHCERAYRFQRWLAALETERLRRERESKLDSLWYQCGFYAALGCDRHGRSYVTTDDEDYTETNQTYGEFALETSEVFRRQMGDGL